MGRAYWKLVLPWFCFSLVLASALAFGVEPSSQVSQAARTEQEQPPAIPATEFSSLIRQFSEDDGFFRSDNLVSNETSYLYVVEKLHDLGCVGGAYIGVGPEQNFTYIAKIRPRIAFIVDIRRQAMIQHLLYKALFHLANNRAQFLSYLFSKPMRGWDVLDAESPIEEILAHLSVSPTDRDMYDHNLALIRKAIVQDFAFPLSDHDSEALEYVYSAFRDQNLNAQYRMAGATWSGSSWGFPTLEALILGKDQRGNLGNFLASPSDYAFVRSLQEQNRIIPLVGDFAGTRALTAVADYLKNNGYAVTAFYTSNVEQYLFANGVFNAFVDNVRKLPRTEKTVFIRAYPTLQDSHPARVSGHRLITLLESMQVFLKDFEDGVYQDYWTLVSTHYIAGDAP
jgi:hypothetical protein